ncbi:hypothetical protein PLEOSDRAFT_1100778 [Pleurotus ostreatus PC15]|uniref:Protein kinase domain-containing protein n=1 Tax=Pleurotus ostreatus (strain PC15) TaxID=1137138 RepID=A0A067P7A7_PLEO1|nr:hypothetical protein PLEOSDRAFT_1100778 [Pleurotus ostreatus PC15]
MEDCTAYSTTERLAKIREADKYSEDQVFMLSYCGKAPRGGLQWPPADLAGPSIAIYHPIFAIFQRALSQTPLPGDISREDLDSASLLISLSTQYYTTEPERQYAISSVVEALLGPSFVFRETLIRCGIISFTLDGNRRANCGLFKRTDPNVTIPNGIGLGESDPIEQAETAYLIVATAPEVLHAFILEISGPYLTVSGTIYVDGVITERLTDFISLVPLLSSQAPLGHASAHDKLTYQIAHFFQYLRECSDQLAADERTVFLAKAERAGQPTIDCIVKFASAYCADAHNIVHEAGAAPRLLYCEFVPSVGKFCVVTEFVHEQEGARLTSAGIQTLQNAVGALRARSYVFGDLRDGNILVDGQGNPNLIDFDWSGIEGNVFYPMNINERIGWVRGVQAGGRIMRDHDIAMLRKFLDAQNQPSISSSGATRLAAE